MNTCIELVEPGKVASGSTQMPQMKTGDALLHILAVGICGSDLHVFTEGHIGTAKAAYPFIMGHEVIARVEETESDADKWLVGKRVSVEPTIFCGHCEYCLGGSPNLCPDQTFASLPPVTGFLREYAAHPARLMEPIPDHLSDAAGTLLEPLAVSLNAIDLLHPRAGSPMAIFGCGAIGLTSLILARLAGFGPILCTDPLAHRREAAMELGADLSVTPEDAEEALRAFGIPHGFPYLIEASGDETAQRQCAELAAPGARIAVIGTNMNDRVIFPGHMARRKGLSILMVRRSRSTLTRCCRLAERKDVAQYLEKLVSHKLSPADAQTAFEIASTYRDGARKVVIIMYEGKG
jgi:L-iditol 2-dehydrogenase